MIFALSDASGICVTTLPHLSSLSDSTACAIKGREREIHACRDKEFQKKRVEKVQQIERNTDRDRRLIGR